MYQTINLTQFIRAFHHHGRVGNFTLAGLEVLFNYLTDLEGEGHGVELDVIALCCEYSHYDTIEDCLGYYGGINTLEDLRDNTTVIEMDNGGVIIGQF